MEQVQSELIDRLCDAVLQGGDAQRMRSRMLIVLSDYDISKRCMELVPYSETKNEMLLRRFMVAKAVAGCGKRTIEVYTSTVRDFLRYIQKDADAVDSSDIQLFIAQKMTKGVSKCYCDNIRRFLSSFYGFLTKEEYIQKNPMMKVEAVKFRKEKEKAFTELEIEHMRNACQNWFQKAMIEVLLSTGCRASELVGIKISDINGEEIRVVGKGDKPRTVLLNAKAMVAIESYLKERKDENPYLFPGSTFELARGKTCREWYKYPNNISKDRHYSRESVNIMAKKIARRAGVEGCHTHRFRRTCATMALRRGMPIEMVSMMLGHEQLSTTQIYLDIREEDLKASHQKYCG